MFPDEETATRICEILVREDFAACANVFSGATSIYKWKGELVHESECLAVIKTTDLKRAGLMERIRATHPYALPGLVFVAVEGGLPEYLNWIYSQSL